MTWMESGNFEYLHAPELENCSIECDIKIMDDNNDPYSWAGFRGERFQIELDHLGLDILYTSDL